MTAAPPDHPIYVVELANVIIFALGCISLVLAFRALLSAKRYRDSAKDWADSARRYKKSAEEMERNARNLLAECRQQYGLRMVTAKKEEEKPS